ncbi:MAG: glycosyltransferase family 39 protein [Candidatus Eisenbacteria bacterium]|uniref:Glycosyltransferase family 39 protein n=1 Tax=Eiseniibacteriota bacterium TaxID=2212470 RepID=A0A956LZV1_UNCEI|nr:glycosyltransferase family 39 protein [Candidatus Eisenbacteria bacterium]
METLKGLAIAACFAILSGWLAWLASAPSIAITPDSVQYISAAQSIAGGAGISTRVTEVGDGGHQPLSSWPPVYPFVLAAGTQRLESGQRVVAMDWVRLVNVLAVILLLFPFAWLARVVVGGTESMLCLVWLAASRPTYLLASFAWSETLFVLLSVSALACTVRGLARDETEAHRVRWLLLAGTMAALAALTRYLGVSLVLALAITVLLRSEGEPSRRTLRRIACVTGPALVSVTVWVGRNLVLTGRGFGSSPPAGEHAASHALLDTLLTLGRDWILPAALPTWLLFPGVVAATAAGLWLLWRSAVGFGPETFEQHPLQLTAATALTQYLWIYLALLLASASTISLDPVNTRLLAPIYPCVILLLAPLLRGMIEQLTPRLAGWALGALAVLFVFQVLGTAEYLVAPRESRQLTAPYWRTVVWSNEEIEAAPQIRYLRRLPAESVVLTNVWEMVTFTTGLPTKIWPERPSPEAMSRRLAGDYLLWDPAYRAYLPDPVELLGEDATRSLRLLGTWDGVKLYRIEPEGSVFTPSAYPSESGKASGTDSDATRGSQIGMIPGDGPSAPNRSR